MTTTQTTSNVSEVVPTYYEKETLDRLEAEVLLYQFSTKKPIPKNAGHTITFHRYTAFATNETDITEGTNPAGLDLTATNVTAQIKDLVSWVKITEYLNTVAINPQLGEVVDLLQDRFNRSIEYRLRAQLDLGTEQLAASVDNITDIATTDTLKMAELAAAVRDLGNANAKPHPMADGGFIGVVPYACTYDLKLDTTTGNWINVNQYQNGEGIRRWKLGRLANVDLYETSLFTTASGASSRVIYNSYVISKAAYGAIEMSNYQKNPSIRTGRGGDFGIEDPGDLFQVARIKGRFAAKILEAERVRVIKTFATA